MTFFCAGFLILVSFVLSIFFVHYFLALYGRVVETATREYTPETHQKKGKVPSFGGIVWCVLLPVMYLFAAIGESPTVLGSFDILALVWLCLLYGLFGFIDDAAKTFMGTGISARLKSSMQVLGALAVCGSWVYVQGFEASVLYQYTAFLPEPMRKICALGWITFIIVGSSNAVNLTDGLDGLAGGCSVIVAACAGAMALAAGHAIAWPIAILIGSLLAFLWFNAYPAKIFMGDVGALSLGALLGFAFIMLKIDFLLALAGIVFVLNTLSVMLQVFWFKRYGRRIFKIAPLHHHFELSGFHETTIVVRAWIVTVLGTITAALVHLLV